MYVVPRGHLPWYLTHWRLHFVHAAARCCKSKLSYLTVHDFQVTSCKGPFCTFVIACAPVLPLRLVALDERCRIAQASEG